MALNIDDFIDKYLEELHENIEQIDTGIVILKKDPNNEDKLLEILRLLHTIKGSSRMLKFNTIEKIAHGLENILKGIKEQRYQIDNKNIQLIFIASDYIKHASKLIKETKKDAFPIDELVLVMEKAFSNEAYDLNKIKDALPKEITLNPKQQNDKTTVSNQQNKSKEKTTQIEYESIKIKSSSINELLKDINSLILWQFQFKKEQSIIAELEQKYEEIRGIIKTNHDLKLPEEYTKKDNSFYKELQYAKKNLIAIMEQVENKTFAIREAILNLKMLPLNLILGSFPRMVEELAINLKKEVNLVINGDDVMLDKTILESIRDPLIHIVRNAIDHGIELPAERKKAGKNKTGNIFIDCTTKGENVIVTIKDDGQGINYEKIREKAIKFEPDKKEEIINMSEESLLQYLFKPGFSTSSKITNISGRGVGMDIVQNKIEKVKGKIRINSIPHKGTEFIISLPLSLATTNGFFIMAAGEKFFMPANFVSQIIMLTDKNKMDIMDKKVFKLEDKIIPLYRLETVIEKKGFVERQEEEFVIIVESLSAVFGILVDNIIEYTSLIFKPLPKILKNLKYIDGIVFDENFNLVNILRSDLLIEKFRGVKNTDLKKRFDKNQREYKKIMLVDDSINTREIIMSTLTSNNYTVIEAVDGIDAMNKLKTYSVDLIITDINMPRMDGFTLIENLQREAKYRDIPIIIMSSYKESEYLTRAKALGTQEYIVKSNFDRETILRITKKIIGS